MPRKYWGLCTLLTSIGAIGAWAHGIAKLPSGFDFFLFLTGLFLALCTSVCGSMLIRDMQRLEIFSKKKEFTWKTHFIVVMKFTVSVILLFSFVGALVETLWYIHHGESTRSAILGPLLIGGLITWGFTSFTGKRLGAQI